MDCPNCGSDGDIKIDIIIQHDCHVDDNGNLEIGDISNNLGINGSPYCDICCEDFTIKELLNASVRELSN